MVDSGRRRPSRLRGAASLAALVLAGAWLAAVRPAAGADSADPQVADGGFEPTATVPTVSAFGTIAAGRALGAWRVVSGAVDLVGPASARAAEGRQFVDLNGNDAGPGAIAQDVPTVPGHRYVVQVSLAGNTNGPPAVKTGSISLGDVTQSFSFDITGHDGQNLGWRRVEVAAVACGTATTLTLRSMTEGERGPDVDDVRIRDAAPSGGDTAGCSGGWSATGSMGIARVAQTATTLPDGRVLVAGGFIDQSGGKDETEEIATASSELYDPATGSWSPTGAMAVARGRHHAVLLADGSVIVVGGTDRDVPVTTAERYDPDTGTWSPTGGLPGILTAFAATALADGRVLVVGGRNVDIDADLADAYIYQPSTGTWLAVAAMAESRRSPNATLLADGRILVTSGVNTANPDGLATAEVYDPATDTWSATGAPALSRQSDETCCPGYVLLATGHVLVFGGYHDGPLAGAELYDPATGSWRPTGALATALQNVQSATRLSDGTVLALGFVDEEPVRPVAELYDPATGTWGLLAAPSTPRRENTASVLADGSVLVAGGAVPADGPLRTAEIYCPCRHQPAARPQR
jgi:choice-of-anchor C domain-containing protein